MTVFADAVDRLFDVPAWTEEALYTAPPAAPVTIAVYRARHDPVIDLGEGPGVRAAGWEGHVRQSEVPARPRPGVDTLTIGAVVFQIRDVEEDAEQTEWRLDLSG